ncbi:MAG: hypothetical protein RQ966_17730 [Acetobacteraceae bacterium]|nr:hypothetical protein [Acetobacteraceae bacterium]
MLTDSEKTDARRFMGYPVFGTNASGNMGWQFYQAAGLVEYRLNNLGGSEEDVLRRYLVSLAALELSVPEAAGALDTSEAGEWKRNPKEIAERSRLFDDWRFRLCSFLGVPPGPGLSGGSSVKLVV